MQYQDALRQMAGGYLSTPTVLFLDGSVLVERLWEVIAKLGLGRLGLCADLRLAANPRRRCGGIYRHRNA
jgi:hypothetical protein